MANFTQKKGFQHLIHVAYGLGAALVIIGALFKLQHWPGAGVMLSIGMITECVIFVLSAFEAMPKKYNWEKVYPELEGNAISSGVQHRTASVTSGAPLDLGISTQQINSIKDGVGKLSSSITGLNELALVAEESQKLTTNLINANQAVGSVTNTSATLSEAYKSTAQIFATLNDESKKSLENMKGLNVSYGEQVNALSKNISAINSSFELQLKENEQYQQTYNNLTKEMTALVGDVKKSVESSAALSNQMNSLSESVAKLNSVYGNMLTSITR